MGRHQLRYWDGTAWTEHVSTNGVTGTDPLQPKGLDRLDSALTVGNEGDADEDPEPAARRGQAPQRARRRRPPSTATARIFSEPILVVNQKAKIIELNNQYGVFDQHGRQVAAVNQVGQSTAKKVLRLVTSLDQFMTHKLEITDPAGAVLLRITRPAKVMKSTVIVSDGRRQRDRPHRAGQHVRQDPLQPAGGRPHLRRDQGRELASVELPHRGPHRHRGRPDHQDVRGHRQDDVHHAPTTTSCRSTPSCRSR